MLSGPDALTIAQLRGALPGDSLRATVDTVLADPIVRRHRLIAADSSIEQIRATWRENVNLLRRLLEAAEPACPKTSDITEAMLTSRFARKRASLDEQAREQTGDID